MDEIRIRNQSQRLFVHAISQAWRNGIQLHDPSLWLLRDPDAEEKMLRDADIAHAVGHRRALIAGKDWQVLPRNEASPRAELAVSVGTELLKGIKHFTTARNMLARAFFSGSRFARIKSKPRTLTIGDGRPRTWLVPTALEDMDKRMYRIVPHTDQQTKQITAHWERWDVGKTDFIPETVGDGMRTIRHVYQDDQATLGHGKALREALGWVWYAKTHVMEETLMAVEKFAQGTLHARVDMLQHSDPDKPNSEIVADYVALLEDMRSKHILVTDKADEIELLPGNADGWQLLDLMEKKLKSSVMTLVLGANLTTSANEGGSYALASVQENSTEMLVQYDRETLEETLSDDLFGWVWWANHPNMVDLGLADDKPVFNITQEKFQDPKERAEVASVLHGMGVALSAEDVFEQTGFRKPEPGEEVIEGGQPPPDPFGGGVPGGFMPAPAAPAPGK